MKESVVAIAGFYMPWSELRRSNRQNLVRARRHEPLLALTMTR